MLVKIEDGFYLNTRHIIAVHVSRNAATGLFEISFNIHRILFSKLENTKSI